MLDSFLRIWKHFLFIAHILLSHKVFNSIIDQCVSIIYGPLSNLIICFRDHLSSRCKLLNNLMLVFSTDVND